MLVKGIALTFDSVIASRYCAVSRDRALIVAVHNDTLSDGEDESPYGHEWPASRLTLTDMARLRIISNQIRKPVNQLLKEAVEFYTTEKLPELGVDPRWQWGDSTRLPEQVETEVEKDTTQEDKS